MGTDASYSRSHNRTSSHDNPKNATVTPRYRMSAITGLLPVCLVHDRES